MRKFVAIAVLACAILAGLGRRAAADDMLTVGDLLAHCHASSALCRQDFSYNSISMAFLWGGNCIPSQLNQGQRDMAVLRWLVKHQDLAQEDAPDGVADAVTALWPCEGSQ